MRILVTGGAGFIGSHIVEHALARGHEVAVLDDLSSGKRENLPKGITLYEVDIRDAAATRSAFLDFHPEAVSHQAAQASVTVSMKNPVLDASVNVVGGLHVAQESVRVGARRLVFASTGGAIYGNIPEGAATEDAPKSPISPYAIDKLAFEMQLGVYRSAEALDPCILRYANVYGPRQDPHGEAGVVAIFLNRAKENLPLRVNARRTEGDAGCIRDYVYVADVARANVLALEGRLGSSLMNLGTGVPTSTKALAEGLLRRSPASTSTITHGPLREGDIERSVLDGGLFRKNVGDFTDLESGLQSTAEWYWSV